MTDAHHRAIARRAGDPIAPYPALADADRMMQTDGVRDAALIVLRSDNPDFAGELARDSLQHRQARRLDAVVIGDENAIQHHAAPKNAIGDPILQRNQARARIMAATETRNLITDVAGILVGQAEDRDGITGTTVVLAEQPAVAAVDVRGGAPGSRETELLAPEALVDRVDAVVLSGGSAFGFDAAAGVMDWLAEAGRGFAVGSVRVPIVPAAILFDLGFPGRRAWSGEPPYRALGRQAAAAAGKDFVLGNAGAGLGAKSGRLKGGLGSASFVLTSGYTVGAIVAVNSWGAVVRPDCGRL